MRNKFVRTLLTVAALAALFPVYAKVGKFGASIYVESKFEEIRWGPHNDIQEVDKALSWFNKNTVSLDHLPPVFLPVVDVDDSFDLTKAQLISYYIREFGFVVVYDSNGKRVTQIKTDV